MATSNRDRIDQGLQLLAAGLRPFVDSAMSASVPAGRDWVELLDARNNQRRGTNFSNSRDDPRFLLSVLTEEWRLFKDKLSRAEQSFASELRDTGNRWGHGTPFSADDTYRALDTMERLLTAVDATAEADAVRRAATGCAAGGVRVGDPAGSTGRHGGGGARPQAVARGDHAAPGRAEREPARRGVRGGPVLRLTWGRVGRSTSIRWSSSGGPT